ncbi:MAG: hypothetical protein LBV31_00105 [Prevotellaceae bacterium]|nr:hypothetical protein [Prevotellaceae bacterium]
MNKRIEIYSLIAGMVFLISGIAKAVDISAFAGVIAQYGLGNLQFVAPLIVLAEVLAGLLLVFQVGLKHIALASTALVAGFTLVFAYGLIFNGIEDCGCFGKITVLNTSPVLTFIRNGILLYLLIALWRKSQNRWNVNKWLLALVVAVMSAVAFMSGYSYHPAKEKKKIQYTLKTVASTTLSEFITTSNDSTYLVFAFTYRCPHCLNSIENLKQYAPQGIVDRVMGIALEDAAAAQKFQELFEPNFSITNYPAKTLSRLASSLPRAYYIRHDSIIAEVAGELPCANVFSEMVRK